MRTSLEQGVMLDEAGLSALIGTATSAPTRMARQRAAELLGDIAGGAFAASWQLTDRAAFGLLEAARLANTSADKRVVLSAIGRAYRNVWLLPYVHRRLQDPDPDVVVQALSAAGGLALPALEAVVASFVARTDAPAIVRAAIAALGRMGATSSIAKLLPFVLGEPTEAVVALGALAEIRIADGRAMALQVIHDELEPEVQLAAARYLAELGEPQVLAVLRRLARHDDPEIRLAASLASRAYKAERTSDAADRFLVALADPDRAVRAVLARRLRTLPIVDVLAQATALLSEDPEGVIDVVAELRGSDPTQFLLALADHPNLTAAQKARAVAAIEADQPWEVESLLTLARDTSRPAEVRAAAVRTTGAFATEPTQLAAIAELAADPDENVKSAVLWALQLAAKPQRDAAVVVPVLRQLLDDQHAAVRRRCCYVVGNLGVGSLAQALSTACRDADPTIRLASVVALGELGEPAVVPTLVAAMVVEQDPTVLSAFSNTLVGLTPAPNALALLAPKAVEMMASPDARLREAGAEVAGQAQFAEHSTHLLAMLRDPSPNVRGAAVWALGKLGDSQHEAAMIGAFRDDDTAVHERAAAGLLRLGTPGALLQAIAFCASDADSAARRLVAAAVQPPAMVPAGWQAALDDALQRLGPDDAAFEPLLTLAFASRAGAPGVAASGPAVDVDAEITNAFPSFAAMTKLGGFEQLVKSLRTAESLFQTTQRLPAADWSAPITLWMKVLENYVHAWLGPRFVAMQREPARLFDYVDRVIAGSWSGFSRWAEPKWRDPSLLGAARVDVPLRSVPNSVRELQERKRKRFDSPLSITEWARLLVLFGIDHPSGFRNLLAVGATGKRSPEQNLALAHRLHTLAAVRNLVTHRATAEEPTAAAFRKSYYLAFEDIVSLA